MAGLVAFGGAMVIVFVLGLVCSSLLERRAEVASVFNNKKDTDERLHSGSKREICRGFPT